MFRKNEICNININENGKTFYVEFSVYEDYKRIDSLLSSPLNGVGGSLSLDTPNTKIPDNSQLSCDPQKTACYIQICFQDNCDKINAGSIIETRNKLIPPLF
jgi:hypothetical protein